MIRESVHFALHGSTVHCHYTIAEDLWLVEADPGQIGQVINNLGINAVQAMPRGGIIEVLAENLTVGEGDEFPLSLEPGDYVKICVEDDGTGIAPEHLVKIFDPFFTTKASGSGLGLATSYSIIKKHGGLLTVDSVRGVGSIFRIYLPAEPQRAVGELVADAVADTVKVVPGNAAGGALKVLIMDDETPVRELIQSMLGYLGHESVGTADGAAAVQTYRQARAEGRPFDLVILDLTVPGGMGGQETFERLRKIEPGVKAVVSSGYANNPIMSDYQDHGFAGVLSKPYRVNELSGALNTVFPKVEVV